MKITVLCENTTIDPALTAEHGLSIFIETADRRILFDMGQTNAFARNAEKLGVDLADVDFAVLSHGHYAHGGGLGEFLRINKKAHVYVSSQAFGDHFNGSEKYIGLDKNLQSSGRLIPISDHANISENTEILTAAPDRLIRPIEPFGLTIRRGGTLYNEDFRHEQFLLIRENQKSYLFSGCAHTGVVNLTEVFSPDVFIGGFHFSKLDPVKDHMRLEEDAERLLSSGCRYYTCHCTGSEQFDVMKRIMGSRLSAVYTGFSGII